MRTVWKFPLQLIERQVVSMPVGTQILTAQLQGGFITLWGLCDDDSERHREDRVIVICGTGHQAPVRTPSQSLSWSLGFPATGPTYIATVQMPMAGFVWHLFDDTP